MRIYGSQHWVGDRAAGLLADRSTGRKNKVEPPTGGPQMVIGKIVYQDLKLDDLIK